MTKAPLPSLTERWHKTSYNAISPTRHELSVANRTLVITGGGRGLGPEIARAYAAAGASHIVLIGRTLTTLTKSKEAIEKDFSSISVTTYTADVSDEAAIGKAAEKIGGWDVLILNAGLLGEVQSIEESNTADWWRVFETNVKGAMVTTHAFLPFRNKDASIIGVNANIISVPTSQPFTTGLSAYICSKFAQIKLLEHVSAENPDVFAVSVHPGTLDTDMLRSLGLLDKMGPEMLDDVSLPAHFLLWLASKEARFLKGKFVCANWDVAELNAKAKEIETTPILEANIHGWPYGGAMDAMLAHTAAEK